MTVTKYKVIRDPIHDLIVIDDEVALRLIDSPEFQRLRYIRQLGFAWLVYPGAEHSRFTHSIGVYHLSKLIADKLPELKPQEKRYVAVAALLHDIGHGPFSHLFERFLRAVGYKFRPSHEDWSRSIIADGSSVSTILGEMDKEALEAIIDLMSKTPKRGTAASIISSQFDADRFDYMLRDCHMTGVKYGRFDLPWLIQNLRLGKYKQFDDDADAKGKEVPVIAVHGRKGLDTVEQYVLGLFHLYQNVYFHKTVIAAECMLENLLVRAVHCIQEGVSGEWDPVLVRIARNEAITNSEYCTLNDFRVVSWIMNWSASGADKILLDLSVGLQQRKLFKSILHRLPVQQIQEAKENIHNILENKGLDAKYYFREYDTNRSAYNDYADGEKLAKNIFLEDDDGKILTYSEYSERLNLQISGSFAQLELNDHYFVVHPDIADIVRNLVRR